MARPTERAQHAANSMDRELSSLLAPLEAWLVRFVHTRLPSIPKEISEVLVVILPYLTAVSVIVMGIGILGMLGLSVLTLPLWFFAAPHILYTIMTVFGWLLSIAALPGLFTREKTGWNFLLYSCLWNALRDLLSLNLFWLVFGLTIPLYLLMQIRPFYLRQLPQETRES